MYPLCPHGSYAYGMVFILGPIAIPSACYWLWLCMFYAFSVVCSLLFVSCTKIGAHVPVVYHNCWLLQRGNFTANYMCGPIGLCLDGEINHPNEK